MPDRADQTLVAHTAGNGLGSIVAENAVLGEILRGTTGVGRTQGVRAGRVGDGDGRIQRILAVHLAKAGLYIVVPGCADDGQRSPAGAVAAVAVLKLTVHALGTIDDGAAGLVDSLDSLDALGVAHVDEQIAQRQLRKEVVPLRVVEGDADHIAEVDLLIQLHAEVEVGNALGVGCLDVGLHIQTVVQLIVDRQGLQRGGVGRIPRAAGQVGDFFVVVRPVVHIGVVEGIGDFHIAVVTGFAVLFGIDLGVGGGPGGHGGGVAGDDIAVLIDQLARNGVTALGGQHIVQCLVCAVADGEVVIARIEDVALRAVGVIGREEVAGHIDRDSLGCTCGHVDFVIAQQLD